MACHVRSPAWYHQHSTSVNLHDVVETLRRQNISSVWCVGLERRGALWRRVRPMATRLGSMARRSSASFGVPPCLTMYSDVHRKTRPPQDSAALLLDSQGDTSNTSIHPRRLQPDQLNPNLTSELCPSGHLLGGGEKRVRVGRKFDKGSPWDSRDIVW